jgi:hypothetical protein
MRSVLQDLGGNQPGWRTSPLSPIPHSRFRAAVLAFCCGCARRFGGGVMSVMCHFSRDFLKLLTQNDSLCMLNNSVNKNLEKGVFENECQDADKIFYALRTSSFKKKASEGAVNCKIWQG